MISESRRNQIETELHRIEKRENVTVLYSCESGSRAWGFASTDSDYDVRFIYLRKTDWYLTIQKKRDVIECPISDDLDISGWDLPKSLGLFRNSNPPLLEWLQSPIVYREIPSATKLIRDSMDVYYSPISCMHHYLNMADGNFRHYLKGEEVLLKKYFYALRPVLACLWIEKGFGIVPTEFSTLLDCVITDNSLRTAVDQLLTKKIAGTELDYGPRIPEISNFLESQLERLCADKANPPKTKDPNKLDEIFHQILIKINGKKIEQSGPDNG